MVAVADMTGYFNAGQFGAVALPGSSDVDALQRMFDYMESRLGGHCQLMNGATHVCDNNLILDPRLVGLDGLGATLDFSDCRVSTVGTDLITGENSTFNTGIGSWTITGGTYTLLGGGMIEVTNTTDAAAQGYLQIPTQAGQFYAVKYDQAAGSGLAQMNMYARVLPTSLALAFDTDTLNTWFIFQAVSAVTYIGFKVSGDLTGNSAQVGNITCKVGTPPGLWALDRSNSFAHVVTPGSGYAVGDKLGVLGGTYTVQPQISVLAVDTNGAVLFAEVTNDGTLTSYPANPVSTAAVTGTGSGATFDIGISTHQFGHSAFPWRNFLLIGPGRDTAYIVDTDSDFDIYSSAESFFGTWFNSSRLAANRNSTSGRGTLSGVSIRNCTAGIALHDQAYLRIVQDMTISNCNFGVLALSGDNAGENNSFIGGVITGCDVNVNVSNLGIRMQFVSLDYPKQAQARLTGPNTELILYECWLEQSPPGLSTQLVTPIALTGDAAQFTMIGGRLQVVGEMVADSFPAMISTTSATQKVFLSGVYLSGIKTQYLVSGPGRVQLAAPCRLPKFPVVPTKLNDQLPGEASFDVYGFGGFDKPTGGGGRPQGLLALGSNLDDASFTQTYSGAWTTDKMTVILDNVNQYLGRQTLAVSRLTNSGGCGLWFAAPCREGFHYWWTFYLKVPAPSNPAIVIGDITGSVFTVTGIVGGGSIINGQFLGDIAGEIPIGTKITSFGSGIGGLGTYNLNTSLSITSRTVYCIKSAIDMTQNFTQLLGIKTLPIALSGASNANLGIPWRMSGTYTGMGQVFPGNTQGGIMVDSVTGTDGDWELFKTDTFNHGTQTAPSGASHVFLNLDFTSFEGGKWGSPSLNIADVQCWEI